MSLSLRSPSSSGGCKGLRMLPRQKKNSFLRPAFLAVLGVLILLLSILQFTTTLVHQGVLYQENNRADFSNKRMAILPQSLLESSLREHRFERKVEETMVMISTPATKNDETSVTTKSSQRSEVAGASLSTHTKEEDLKKRPQNTTPKQKEIL
jgi:hypothetical protein